MVANVCTAQMAVVAVVSAAAISKSRATASTSASLKPSALC